MKALILLCTSVLFFNAALGIYEHEDKLPADVNSVLRVRRQAQQHGQNYQQPQVNYRPYSQAPASIKQILQFQQAREPLVHLPPQPPPNLGPVRGGEPVQVTQGQLAGYQPQVQFGNAPQQPNYKSNAAQIASQYRPQNQQYAQ